jgi:hypothetical protein
MKHYPTVLFFSCPDSGFPLDFEPDLLHPRWRRTKGENSVPTSAAVLARIDPQISNLIGFRQETDIDRLPTGLAAVDRLLGGCPRGRITEIVGPETSGRTSLLHGILASAGARGEYCAVVDPSDAFDTETAAAAGVALETLVWVRCGGSPNSLEHAMKSVDLLLHGGGFGVVALDLCDVAPRSARRIPASWWHRFRRAVEGSDTVLVVLAAEAQARSCASLAAEAGRGEWQFTGRHPRYLLESACFTLEARRPWRPGGASFRAAAADLDRA